MSAILSSKKINRLALPFRIAYILMWTFAGILLIIAFMLPFSQDARDELSRLPMNFSIKAPDAILTIDGTEKPTEIMRASGLLTLDNAPLVIPYINLLFYVMICIVTLLVIKKILLIIDSIEEKTVFTEVNILRLRSISVILICFNFALIILGIISSYYISSHFKSDSITHDGIIGPYLDFEPFMLPLFLFVIAEVFRLAVKMKEEQDLTI